MIILQAKNSAEFVLLRGARVFAPEDRGIGDVLIHGGKVLACDARIDPPSGTVTTSVSDLSGLLLTPGLLDPHCHPTGAGGVSGPETRSPDLPLSAFAAAGVTTIVGVLGGDGISRQPLELLARVRALNVEGLSAYMLIGAYQVPPPTITGDLKKDVYVVPECLGAGEIAINDSRGSHPTVQELSRIIADAHMGGRLAGKCGVTNIHVGTGKWGLELLRQTIHETDTPIDVMIPTHLNRTSALLDEAAAWGQAGGWVDLTTSIEDHLSDTVPVAAAVPRLLDEGTPLERITLSTDAGGVFPVRDDSGGRTLHRWESASLLQSLCRLHFQAGLALPDVLRLATTNAAVAFGLPGKGRIRIGGDADLVALTPELDGVTHLWSGGRQLRAAGRPLVRGTFEEA